MYEILDVKALTSCETKSCLFKWNFKRCLVLNSDMALFISVYHSNILNNLRWCFDVLINWSIYAPPPPSLRPLVCRAIPRKITHTVLCKLYLYRDMYPSDTFLMGTRVACGNKTQVPISENAWNYLFGIPCEAHLKSSSGIPYMDLSFVGIYIYIYLPHRHCT